MSGGRSRHGRNRRPAGEEGEGSGGSAKWLSIFIRSAGPYMGAAYALTGGLLGLGFVGYLLDLWLGTSPAFVLVGLGLGLVVGFYELAKVMFKGPRR